MGTLQIEMAPAFPAQAPRLGAIIDLCSAAYEEPFAPILRQLAPVAHVLGWLDGELVAHACWVDRRLQIGDAAPLRTAFVEAVATAPAQQRRGFGGAIVRALVPAIADYELAALSPAHAPFYARLGWESWRGPLSIRTDAGALPTPDEAVMILRLPRTPPLDLDAPLSAEWRPGELW